MKVIKCKECIKYIKDTNKAMDSMIRELSKFYRLIGVLNKRKLDDIVILNKNGGRIGKSGWEHRIGELCLYGHPDNKEAFLEDAVKGMKERWSLYTPGSDSGAFIIKSPPKIEISIWPSQGDLCPLMVVNFEYLRLEPGMTVVLEKPHDWKYRNIRPNVAAYWDYRYVTLIP